LRFLRLLFLPPLLVPGAMFCWPRRLAFSSCLDWLCRLNEWNSLDFAFSFILGLHGIPGGQCFPPAVPAIPAAAIGGLHRLARLRESTCG
jgi:hypothetical protein